MKRGFEKPTPEQVTAYALTIGFRLDGNRFFDYYEARDWMYPERVPMSDWMCEVRSWRRRNTDAGALFDVEKQKYAQAMAGKTTQQAQFDEALKQLVSIRSWRGSEGCPFCDPAEEERRFLSVTRNKFGASFVSALLERAR